MMSRSNSLNQSGVHQISDRDAPEFSSHLLCAAIVLYLQIIALKKSYISGRMDSSYTAVKGAVRQVPQNEHLK